MLEHVTYALTDTAIEVVRHSKPLQSDESKQFHLSRAEAKRERRAKRNKMLAWKTSPRRIIKKQFSDEEISTAVRGAIDELTDDQSDRNLFGEPSGFKVGDKVYWTSSGVNKVGEIRDIVPAGQSPKDLGITVRDNDRYRDHESYIVYAVTVNSGKVASHGLYWPRVSLLKRRGAEASA